MANLRGVHFMLPTPFHDDGALDLDSIDALIDCAAQSHCAGVVCLGVMGEAARLTDAERTLVTERVVRQAAGRLAVTVGATGSGTDAATQRVREATELGADALMVSPPPIPKQNLDAVSAYFHAVADASPLDLVVQDYPAQSGVFMPSAFIARLTEELPTAHWLKLEDPPTPPKVSAIRALAGDRLGVFGGLGGVFLLEELARGACGAMTGFAYPEALVETQRLMDAGDADAAAEHFFRWLPLIRYEAQEGVTLSIRKEILQRRGLLASAKVRHPGAPIDAATRAEMHALVDRIAGKD